MTRSYLEHFGLAEAPFSLTSDPRFIYPSRAYSAALAEVTGAVERREGLIVITGGHGTGKTTLCRALIQHLPLATRLSAIPSPHVTAGDLVSQIAADFGVTAVKELDRFLMTLVPAGTLAVVIIDEAQQLERGALEQIRLLSNLEANGSKLLQMILVGQPDLRAVLERDAPEVDRRISRRSVMRPLAPDEVGPYIERRLEVARGPIDDDAERASAEVMAFAPDAVELIAQLSRGVPRIINLVGDHALDIGAEGQGRTVAREIVLAAADRLQLIRSAPEVHTNTRLAAMAVVAAVLALVAAGVWLWAPSSRSGGTRSTVAVAPLTAPVATPVVPPRVQTPPAEPPREAAVRPLPPTPPVEPSRSVAAAAEAPPAPKTSASAAPAQPVPPPPVAPTATPPAPATAPAPASPKPTAAPAASSPPPAASPAPAPVRPAAPPAPEIIPIADSFTVAVASPRTDAEAADTVKKLSALGLPAFSRAAGRGRGRTVLVGPYASREEAVAAKTQMEELRNVKARVIVESHSRRE